ncbi:DUF742 domain-containing protein [Amycolatopsis methanolica]|uniref:DUF742 domain-containing protein n=1 Tax=Amycolatopsis methanolica 239 TaxID=1068978 RepID=A0A076N7K1_AMYME|nr:DUF742 domain-containing protein [Amycolatopsis methanolica]AIJ26870.1 hypothetical protein AMETH_6778 [Amycolatopsis methanolica 239]
MGVPDGTGPAGEPGVPRAGARFPSVKQLRKLTGEHAEPPGPEPQAPGRAPAETTKTKRAAGARFPAEKQLARFGEPEPRPAPEPEPEPLPDPEPREEFKPSPRPRPEPAPAAEPEHPELLDPDDENRLRVRPYVLTKGRTHSAYELAIETLVSVRADAKWTGPALSAEYQPVRAVVDTPRSLAEVAALLSIPLGVARVLLSDMAELGLLHIHGIERTAEGRPPLELMKRVLDGLQRL